LIAVNAGRSVENRCIESVNGKFRNECLEKNWGRVRYMEIRPDIEFNGNIISPSTK
jgi:hypothetical protein